MERFDVLVIGSGSGMIVASTAVDNGFKTAIVDSGPMGGTCINRGCVPSKMLIYPIDAVSILKEAQRLGVNATVNSIDFKNIMTRTHNLVNGDSATQARAVKNTPELTWFNETGEFISDYTMQVGEHTINAELIFIVSGARPGIPPIKGIENVDYLTSDAVLELETPPKSIIIIGGGYVGAEYGHFFSGIGTKTTIIQRASRILPDEEPEISDLLKRELEQRMEIYTDFEVGSAKQEGAVKTVIARNRVDGSLKEFSAEALMIAAGRVPNSDILKPEKTGVKLDERGYVMVNEYLETSKKNIWAFGDAIGKKMFRHAANHEAELVWHNAVHGKKSRLNYLTVPHAVFSWPEIASVGLGEAEAVKLIGKQEVLVGKAMYTDVARGEAMREVEGFVKAIVHRKTGKVLGYHIIGPHASILIQEVVNAMAADGNLWSIAKGLHIHPALPEVVLKAFGRLQPVQVRSKH